jgi:post-segregation antitoxin (ccd killing protein)
MTQRHTLLSIYITTALIVILGAGCAKASIDNSYRPTSARGPCTPKARAASMRKALRETSEGQKIHQAYVEKKLEILQHERDANRNNRTITDIERSEIESQTRIWEEENIEDLARKNCYLENMQSKLHRIAKETSSMDTLLRLQESLYKRGQINEKEIQRARTEVQLKKEEYWLRQKFVNILISANNHG